MSGVVGLPQRTPYCASKFAVTGFFHSLQYEETDITFSLIYPPTITGTNFRVNSLNGAKQHPEKPSSLSLPLKETTDFVMDAADRHATDVCFPTNVWLFKIIYQIWPNFWKGRITAANAKL